jgi:hypothetical protein
VCVCWGACVVGSRVAAVVRERGEEGCDRRERSWEVACVCLPYLWIVLCARTYGGGYLSYHQDFQIRKVSSEYLRPNGKASRCEDRRKAYGKFWSPEEACVISVKSRRLCAISGLSSQSRGSFHAWTREDFRERRFAAKFEVRLHGNFGNGVSRRAKSKFASKGHAFTRTRPKSHTPLGLFLAQPAHAVGSCLSTSKVEVRLEGSRVLSSHTYLTETAHSARLIPRSTGSHRRLVAVNERRGKASRARRRPLTGASDSGWARKASYGARRRFDEA